MSDVPVYIINRNRISSLVKLVNWLLTAGTKEITIIDNDSTYPPVLDYYEHLPLGVVVIRNRNQGPTVFWELGLYKQQSNYYVVTDADVVPAEGCPVDLIEKLKSILARRPEAKKVGPGLRTDNLPDSFARKREVITWEQRFTEREAESGVYHAQIDTTFAIYQPYANWTGPDKNLRLAPPYVFEHVPWYIDSNNLSEEEQYYRDHVEYNWSYWCSK